MIVFTKHAEDKFHLLKSHKFTITRHQVISACSNPDLVDYARLPLLIAQKQRNKTHVLRVVYKQENSLKKIITFYPGRAKHYAKT